MPDTQSIHIHDLADFHQEGGVSVDDLANAIQIWSILQPLPTTVRDVAASFKITGETVRAAVEGHPWMYLSGPAHDRLANIIEHEGE
ncbi:hypothetical protein [Methylosinus sp. PW1]|uniref:hypothetical protein n=1 Tax=Methylosinus sp. PW1 TaxID=107636 RepID=UPI00056D25A3|nr:hypothetical protein [Methylosinus sp. PW1]